MLSTMNCCSKKEGKEGEELVVCETCGLKTGRSVAAVMYLKGEEHFFCSHACQDRWEETHPGELW